MLSDALSYPQSGDGWRPVFIGGLLSLFNWLLLPAFVVFGYYIRVLRGTALEEDEAPRFEDFGDLLVDGFKSFIIFLGYVFSPILIEIIILFSAGSFSGALETLFALVGLIGVVFLFVLLYLFPVALTTFALTDSLSTAFELRTIASAAFTGDYALSVFLSVILRLGVVVALTIVGYMIWFVFGFVVIFGIIGLGGADAGPSLGIGVMFLFIVGLLLYMGMGVLFSVVNFYTQMAVYHLFGRGCGPSLREAVSVDRPTPAGASDVGLERSDVGWDSDVDSESEDRPDEEQ